MPNDGADGVLFYDPARVHHRVPAAAPDHKAKGMETSSIEKPRSARKVRMHRKIWFCAILSGVVAGSSGSTRSGRGIRETAMAARCRIPPATRGLLAPGRSRRRQAPPSSGRGR